jgi:hypothetical protein
MHRETDHKKNQTTIQHWQINKYIYITGCQYRPHD